MYRNLIHPIVLNIKDAEKFVKEQYREPFWMISITSPSSRLADVSGNPFLKSLLRVSFYDTNVSYTNDGIEYNPISEEQAREIADFANSLYKNDMAENLVIHCEAGISRSSGVAAAISKFYNHDDRFFFKNYVPNMRCYTLVLLELEVNYNGH